MEGYLENSFVLSSFSGFNRATCILYIFIKSQWIVIHATLLQVSSFIWWKLTEVKVDRKTGRFNLHSWFRRCMSIWFLVETCFHRFFFRYLSFPPAPKTGHLYYFCSFIEGPSGKQCLYTDWVRLPSLKMPNLIQFGSSVLPIIQWWLAMFSFTSYWIYFQVDWCCPTK